MADQDIKIKITTDGDTSGAKEVEQALEGVTGATPTPAEMQAAADAQERLNAAVAEYYATAPQATEAAGDFGDKLQEVSDNTEETADGVEKVDGRVKAIAFAKAAQLAGGFADSMRVVADSMRVADPEAAKTLDTIGELGSGIATVTGAAAQGFAAGGPWGAVAGATIGGLGLVFNKFTEEIDKHREAIALAATAQGKLTGKIREANEAIGENKYAKLGLDTKAAKDQTDALNLSFQRQLELQNDLRKVNETRAENAAKLDIAQINIAESAGGISADQADQQRAQIRANIAELNKQAALAQAEERYRAEQLELDNLSRYQAAVEKKIQEGNDELALLSGKRADLQNELASAQSGGASQAAISRIQDALDRNSGQLDKGSEDLAALEKELGGIPEKVEQQIATIEAVRASVELANQEIESDFGTAEITTKADELVNKNKEQAEKLANVVGGAIAEIEPQNRLQSEALSVLKAAVSDGQVTASEMAGVAQAVANMGSNINGNMQQILQALAESNKVQSANAQIIKNLRREIDALKAQTSQLLTR